MILHASQASTPLLKYWHAFIENGAISTPAVRDVVFRSWDRCLKANVSPRGKERHKFIDGNVLETVLLENRILLNAARPFMDDLYEIVKGTGFVVVLANKKGYILELLCDKDAVPAPITSNFFIGASWHEYHAGTNAIGTALEEQCPVQITGAEHFRRIHHWLTCSAAPIVDPAGKLIGILDISGDREGAHKHTLGMVVAAAKAITAHLRITRKNNQLAAANRKLINFFNMVSDGVVILDQYENVSELNPAAKRILNKKGSDLVGLPFQSLLHRGAGFKRESSVSEYFYSRHELELTLETASGPCRCFASTEPINNEQGRFDGSFITLRPIKEVQSFVNRFSGYTASLQFSDIIAKSPEMIEVIEMARLSANSISNVLLQGESGTGKEIFAQAIHNSSSRGAAPFIPLNCGAIPRELVGSELFGYEDGAFTGAKRGGKPGKFELASGGTLFLDEIGDMPLEHQAVLLRVIQEKRMTRIGGLKVIPVDVRLICATHKNLLEKVKQGTFRQDLYYRLNVMSITIPPLRERREDIGPLFKYFLDKLCRDRGASLRVATEIMSYLCAYHWPGNVRELQNVVERAANLTTDGLVGLDQIPVEITLHRGENLEKTDQISLQSSRSRQRQMQQNDERHQLIHSLDINSGNISKVARELGVSRRTIYNRMRRYQISY